MKLLARLIYGRVDRSAAAERYANLNPCRGHTYNKWCALADEIEAMEIVRAALRLPESVEWEKC